MSLSDRFELYFLDLLTLLAVRFWKFWLILIAYLVLSDLGSIIRKIIDFTLVV